MRTVHLVKRKSPTKRNPKRQVWQLRWRSSNGGRYHGKIIGEVGKMSKRDAEKQRNQHEGQIENRIIPRDKPERVTLQQFMDQYGESVKADVRPTTALEYDHAVNHAKDAWGDIVLSKITTAHVDRLKSHLSKQGKSAATIRKTVTVMSALLNRAKRYGLVHDNPVAGAKKVKVQSKSIRVFTPDEIGAMLVVCHDDQWWTVFINLAVRTGMRKGELLHLQWSDIDFDNGYVTVSRKDAGRFTVKAEDYPILEWSAKSHEERKAPVPDDTLDMLQRFRLKSGGSRYVFLSLERLRQIDQRMRAGTWGPKSELINNFGRRFRTIQRHARQYLAEQRGVKLADVEWRIGSVHDLRRTYATTMAQHVDMMTLTRWLGHADVNTTQRFYHEALNETAERARNAISAVYNPIHNTRATHKAISGDPSTNGNATIAVHDPVSA